MTTDEYSVKTALVQACTILLGSNLIVGTVMSIVYWFGKDSWISSIVIYAPVSLISLVLIRDKYPFSYILSNLLAIGHGLAHVTYPFLNELIGVNKSIDVWQDQIIHLGQSILVGAIFFNNSTQQIKVASLVFALCNLVNVIVCYNCWGQWCHNLYVWVSLAPALASGLHFATGCLFQNQRQVAQYGFIIQGTSSIITFFLFKASDDILKLFALCRFFEIYFIVPHYVGFFYGRYIIYKKHKSNTGTLINGFLEVIGVYPTQMNIETMPSLTSYFNTKEIKND